jgi:hypothetical protein
MIPLSGVGLENCTVAHLLTKFGPLMERSHLAVQMLANL